MARRLYESTKLASSRDKTWIEILKLKEHLPEMVGLAFYGPRGGFRGQIWVHGRRLAEILADFGFIDQRRHDEGSDTSDVV